MAPILATTVKERFSGFYSDHCIYMPAMLGWFFFSAILSSYNKVVFGQGKMHFPCPLLLTSIHFFVQWTFSYTVSSIFPQTFGGDVVKNMSWSTYLSTSLICGCVTSFDVGLSNMSLVYISITFYTMIKASSPVFVLIFASIMGIEKITLPLVGVVLTISLGEFLTVRGEKGDFSHIGLILCICASMLSGLRWTTVQYKLSTLDPPLKTTISTIRVISSSMFVSMFILSFIIEKPWITLAPSENNTYFIDFQHGIQTVSMGIAGAFLAICMILCEFYLIMKSSAMVLMIGGVIKEMVTIFVGVEAFHDTLNLINIIGCCVVFSGVIMYKIIYMKEKERKQKEKYRQIAEDEGDDNDIFNSDFDEEDISLVEPDSFHSTDKSNNQNMVGGLTGDIKFSISPSSNDTQDNTNNSNNMDIEKSIADNHHDKPHDTEELESDITSGEEWEQIDKVRDNLAVDEEVDYIMQGLEENNLKKREDQAVIAVEKKSKGD